MRDGNRLVVAVAQVESVLGDIAASFDKHLALIDEARAAGGAVMVFAEMSLTGHSAGPETLDLAIRSVPSSTLRAVGSWPCSSTA